MTRKHTDIYFILLLTSATLIFVILLTHGKYLFGSNVDWINQHSVLPEYFRNQFYETGTLFTEFAPQLGAGQNLFHFSYYGLFSPIILLSYLFPKVPMTVYISFVSMLLAVVSGILCYLWVRHHKISAKAAFIASFLFQFSSAFLYHSHKQIMFVNYMPFLLIALFGVDRFFERKKSSLLMVSIFFMILTSYFFSVGGLLVITVYGIYMYAHINGTALRLQSRKRQLQQWIYAGLSFALRLIIPVGCAAFLLLPSLGGILQGRSNDSSSASIFTLFVPKFSLENLLYNPYGVGLTAICLLSMLYLFYRNQSGDRIFIILLITLFSIPAVLYLLNGGLYLRGKVFIPFLPLFSLITGFYFSYAEQSLPVLQGKEKIPLIIFLILLLLFDRSIFWFAFIAECAIVIFFSQYGHKRQNFFWYYFPSCLICFTICLFVNFSDSLVTKKQNDEIYSMEKQKLLTELTSQMKTNFSRFNDFTNTKESCNYIPDSKLWRTSLYSSTYHTNYNQLHHSFIGNAQSSTNHITCTDSKNLLFQTLMGVRYVISEDGSLAGYKEIAAQGKYHLYENPSVFPIAWGSSSLMSMEEFLTLNDAQKPMALLERIIISKIPESKKTMQNYQSPLKKESISLPFPLNNTKTGYLVSTDKPFSLSLPLSKPLNEQLMLLSFSFFHEPKEQDIVISANKIVNRLTKKKSLYPNLNFDFVYSISENMPNRNLNLEFSSGIYEFSFPELYSLDITDIKKAAEAVTPLYLTTNIRSNSVLSGTIMMEQDGYFTASIPYDLGFTAYVDGKEQEIELVNTCFLGFPLTVGEHTIELVYHAPWFTEGKQISFLCFFVFISILFIEHIVYLKKRRIQESQMPNIPAPLPQPVFSLKIEE